MELVRTIRLKLLVSPEQKQALDTTLTANRNALNFTSKVAFQNGGLSAFKKLQQLVYRQLREDFGLKSQMACNVCSAVASTYASAKSNKRMKLSSFSHSKLVYSYNRDYTVETDKHSVSIGTLDKRIKVPFLVGENYLPYLLSPDWLFGSAELVPTHKGYSLHVTVKRAIDEPNLTECDAMIGVDRGMNFLAVATNQDNKTMFFKGRSIKEKKAKLVRQRKDLQRKGTRSAKRKLKKLAGRENRFMTDINHQVANEVIKFAKASGSRPCIVLEDLTNINMRTTVRLRDRYWRFSWAFGQLESIIRYKAVAEGIPVLSVSPKYTSQKCPKCGHTEKENRDKKKHWFECRKCHYKLNDDLVGARNIRDRGRECRHEIEITSA
ncbi:RNA-guided endonuclease InsQ/TnpB family protein [Alicyclobacillus tolerans]|uniref:RNA-guided endonuclease InsQ/TnpB family protein n=1 Tax=Alicyclobacillus tolerans TaxID=90970 RepID=UPI003B786335